MCAIFIYQELNLIRILYHIKKLFKNEYSIANTQTFNRKEPIENEW